MSFEDSIVKASMAENNSSLTNNPETDSHGSDVNLAQGEGLLKPAEQNANEPAGSQQTIGKPENQGFDYEWTKKYPRYGKIWKSDRDVIKSAYESDKILETKYKPAYKQYEGIVKKLKEFGYDSDKIEDFFNEHKTLKDPENPVNALGGLLLQWKDDPFVPDIEQFFKDLETRKMQRDYPGMTIQQITQFKELQQKLESIEKRESERLEAEQAAKNEELKNKYIAELQAQFSEIEKEAQELGIELTDEIREKLYQKGIETSMEPSLLRFAFRDIVKDQYEKGYENKIKSRLMESQNKNRKIPIGASKVAPEKKSFIDKFADAMRADKSVNQKT